MTAALWLVCAMLSGLLGGIVWAGWRHAPGDRAFMLVLAALMGVAAATNFAVAVLG